ncbi:hypothetical protein BaRGS_00003722, partial [Batillaria attramentaria]
MFSKVCFDSGGIKDYAARLPCAVICETDGRNQIGDMLLPPLPPLPPRKIKPERKEGDCKSSSFHYSRWMDPPYETQAINVTVIEGKTALLPCSVPASADKKSKVVWTDQWITTLTLQENRIIDDERIRVDHAFEREWNLRIERVKHADQGIYTCQINTKPIRAFTVHLTVVVPPRLSEDATSGDVLVREGSKAELVCNATGIPAPTITWYRKPQAVGQRTESEFCTGTS